MLNNLQILRAFAALNVVLFHIIIIGEAQGFGIPSLEFLSGWGANGVDIFFVLSGFLMVYIAELRPREPLAFLKNRAIRIIPIYWILTAVGVLAVLLAGDFQGQPVTGELIAGSFLFFTRWADIYQPIIYVGWTLEWEMLFYLIFGLCLIFKDRAVQFALPLVILTALVFLGGQNPIILEFGFGMIVAKLSKLEYIKANAGVIAMFGASLLLGNIWIKPDLPQAIIWGLPSALLVLGLANAPQWKFRLGKHLGDASYSIYLIQVFTIPAFYKAAERIVPDMSTLGLAMGCLIGTAIVGSLFHLAVEKPMQTLLTRKKAATAPYNIKRFRGGGGKTRLHPEARPPNTR